jgi:hypothetical protein
LNLENTVALAEGERLGSVQEGIIYLERDMGQGKT